MVALEREGYLAQPHTSAGRVPTDKGYRYFVDHLEAGVLGPAQQRQVRDFFAHVRGEVEDVLEQTSTLLSQLTHYTSVVVGAGHSTREHLERAAREPRRPPPPARDGLLRRHGHQAQRAAELRGEPRRGDRGLAPAERAAHRHDARDHRSRCPRAPTPSPSWCARRSRVLHAEAPTMEGEQVYIGGSSRVAEVFEGVETVRKVLGILEQELLVVSLVEDILDKGVSVAIGSEHGFEPLSSCAVIVAPVSLEGETDRRGRAARPDAHEVPRGDGRGRGGLGTHLTAALRREDERG